VGGIIGRIVPSLTEIPGNIRKSLLIGHDGEKYSPVGIEETIAAQSSYIDQIMLYNNQSPYTTALLVPNRDTLGEALARQNLSPATVEGQD